MQLSLLKESTKAQLPVSKTNISGALLESIRRESLTFLIAVNYVNDSMYSSLRDVPTAAMKITRDFLSPRTEPEQQADDARPLSKSVKLLKPVAEVTKQRRRTTLMLKRIVKKEPLFFFARVQSKLIENPEYYGVCILPTEKSCAVNPGQRLGWIARQGAIERENALRRNGL